jgi:predicted DNA-binding transcriptional regulator AlpA
VTTSVIASSKRIRAAKLAERLGVSLRTIRHWDAIGRLPEPLRLSARVVCWESAEIEDWLAAGAPDRETWLSVKQNNK